MRQLSLVALLIFLVSGNLLAQLSPGELSRPHAYLEGLENCNKCHGFEEKLSPDKCLACHLFLAARIKAGQGLHANTEHSDCGSCHVEHQGRNFIIIHWNGGEEKFDHNQTGYKLDGKHAKLECRACHKSNNINPTAKLQSDKIDLNRTFLGTRKGLSFLPSR